MSKNVDEALSWCTTKAIPLLEAHDPTRLQEVRSDLDRVERLRLLVDQRLNACFLGNAGVGKSTLINAMVAGSKAVLPQGGVGPLTAQATSVQYSAIPFFEAEYQSAKHLNQLLFIIERGYARELERAAQSTAPDSKTEEFNAEDPVDGALVVDLELSSEEERSSARAEYRRQARQLIQGTPVGELDVCYLVDGLRAVLGLPPRWGSTLGAEDAQRVGRLKQIVARPEASSFRCEQVGHADFSRDLNDHASGFLAPFIKRLTVGWDSPLLHQGLVLVDLPGVGIANDIYRQVTNQYVAHDAQAIVLVMDRSGVSQASADLLRESRFFVRLLSAADNPDADQVQLVLAVVKADLVADTEWSQERAADRASARKWTEHFESVRGRLITAIQGQLREVLGQMIESSGLELRTERQQMVDRILASVEVHPVSAVEFRKFLDNDEEDRPRIASAEQSHLPQLMDSLSGLAARRRQAAVARLVRAINDIRARIRSSIELLQSQHEQDTRALRELEELEKALEPLRRKLSEELKSRQGAFRNFLGETVPQLIDAKVALAAAAARDDIRTYVDSLKSVSWATLRAAVRRGGAFDGARRIDLPVQLSVRFEEPIATVWARDVLSSLRNKTSEVANAYASIAGDVLAWAATRVEASSMKVARLEQETMVGQAKAVASFGDDTVDALRGRVRAELIAQIEAPIRERCQRFVASSQDKGTGVKGRLMELIAQLVPDVVAAAEKVARKILHDNFKAARDEIHERLTRFPDPVERMADGLLGQRKQESAAARELGARVTAATRAVLSADPGALTAEGAQQ